MDKRSRPAEVRFWEKVDKSGECWLWRGARGHRLGYGRFRPSTAVQVWAHRWSYESVNGTIPDSMGLDHLCRVPACVRPDHLEPVTQRTNVLRGVGPTAVNARKTECIRQHPLSGDNLIVNASGSRECRACKVARDAAGKRRRKANVR